ncbi:recombinase family protein [Actinosynnema sp. CA-299493]
MLRAIADPANRVDAIVVGEYERAFFDNAQLDALRVVLERHGVQLWLPEAGGLVRFGSPLHEALLTVLAARSQAEVVRSRHRVTIAMRMQTVEQGRYLGGRPPYGYRLVDAGAHPNRALARRGVRQQRLEPDPATAPIVKLIFGLRLAGHSTARIARHLNEQATSGPSGADPERNPHRTARDWSLRTIAEILRNPRYTGRQVWNRTSADRAQRSATGRRASVRNDRHDWAISTSIAHTPLVSEHDFLTAQTVDTEHRDTENGKHVYALSGRLRCGHCGRRLDAHRVHDRPAYRCRHGHNSAHTRPENAPRNLYLREDRLLTRIGQHLTAAGIATDPTPEQTIRLLRDLDLAFRCDTTGITLVDRRTSPPRTRRPRGRTAKPAPRQFGADQLVLHLNPEPDVPQTSPPGTPAEPPDTAQSRARRTRHARHRARKRTPHRAPSRRQSPQDRLSLATGNVIRSTDTVRSDTEGTRAAERPDSAGERQKRRRGVRRCRALPAPTAPLRRASRRRGGSPSHQPERPAETQSPTPPPGRLRKASWGN